MVGFGDNFPAKPHHRGRQAARTAIVCNYFDNNDDDDDDANDDDDDDDDDVDDDDCDVYAHALV